MSVTPFRPTVVDAIDDETKQRQIDLLIEFLARVRSGDIVAVAFAGATADGRSFTNWASRPGIEALALSGAVSILTHELGGAVHAADDKPIPAPPAPDEEDAT
jgi:hypothetical protein